MENSIEITKGPKCWLATFHGPHAASIIEAFGTATLPLPLEPEADPNVVLAHIARSNAGCHVRLAVTDRPFPTIASVRQADKRNR